MTNKATGYGSMRLCAGRAMSLLGRGCVYVMLALLPAASGCDPAADQTGKQIFVRELNGKTLNLTEMLRTWKYIVDPATGKPISLLGGREAELQGLGWDAGRLRFHEGLCSAYPFVDGWMDATGRLVGRGEGRLGRFREGRAILWKTNSDGNTVSGIVDRDGRWVVPPGRYEKLGEISEGRCAFRVGNRWGFVDLVGNEVIPPSTLVQNNS